MACFCTGACRQLGYCPVAGDSLFRTSAGSAPWSHGIWPERTPALREGWICPQCQRSNAPDVTWCSCGGSDLIGFTGAELLVPLDADGEATAPEITDDMLAAAMRADTEHRHAGLEERIRAVLEAALRETWGG